MTIEITVAARNVFTVSSREISVVVEYEPISNDGVLMERVGETLVVAYLTLDNSYTPIDERIGDGMGKLYSFHRHAKRGDFAAGMKVIGNDIYGCKDDDIKPDMDGVVLDCYQHGGVVWSVSGAGMQCQFDTARGAGVWVPDDELRKQIGSEECKGKGTRHERCVHYCKQFLHDYNAISNGEVYGCVLHVYKLDSQENWEHMAGNDEALWGFIGYDAALKCLKEDHFDPVVKQLHECLPT